MNIKRLFEKTSTGLKEFVAKVDFANVIGLGEELTKYIKKDSDNEANVNYVNSNRDKILTTGYNGIKYNVVTENSNDVMFNVTDDGNCVAKRFHSYSASGKNTYDTNITSNNIDIIYNTMFGSNSININPKAITITNTTSGFDENHTAKTIYSAVNIKRNDFTYTFPDKSGIIELVDEDKDNKLKHIALVDGSHNSKYCNFASSFKSFEELFEYVNNNKGKITEAYTIYNDETNIHCVSLGTDGALVVSHFGLDGFAISYGNIRNDSNTIIDKTLGFNDQNAVFPANLQLITDNNELYSLNLERCIELGILTKDNTTVQISNTNLIV